MTTQRSGKSLPAFWLALLALLGLFAAACSDDADDTAQDTVDASSEASAGDTADASSDEDDEDMAGDTAGGTTDTADGDMANDMGDAAGGTTGTADGDTADGDMGDAADGMANDMGDAADGMGDGDAAGDTAGTADGDMGDAADGMADVESGFPVTINSDGGTWTLESAPQRIVSLSPTATEVLFAVGAGDQVEAVDSYSYYPPEAPVTDLSAWNPNVEAVVAYEPDFVVVSSDSNDLVGSLSALQIPVLLSPAPTDLEGGYETIAEIGRATGHSEQAAELIESLRAEIMAALAQAPEPQADPIRVYHELDDTHYSVSSASFIGQVYAAMGAANIADAADPDNIGYPQLTEEHIVTADPQLIVITDQVGYTADDVAARPGWEQVSAVSAGNIVTVEADIASRWGPRLPQFVAAVAQALTTVTAGEPAS